MTTRDDDAALVRAAVAGDEAAIERLLIRAQEVAWRFSLAVCGRPADAEDAMQEALLKTYRHVSRLREADAFRPWLHRVVKNACLVSRRRRVHQPTHVESLDAPAGAGAVAREVPSRGHDPEQSAAHAELRGRLKTAVASLPPTSRAVVFLRDIEGLSTREVASVMGTTEEAVKTRLSRARRSLQAVLADPVGATGPLPRDVRARVRTRTRRLLESSHRPHGKSPTVDA